MEDITKLILSVNKLTRSFRFPNQLVTRTRNSLEKIDFYNESIFYALACSLINDKKNFVLINEKELQVQKCISFELCVTSDREFLAHSPILEEFSIGWLAIHEFEDEYSIDSTLWMPIDSKIYGLLDDFQISEVKIELTISDGRVFMGFSDRLFAAYGSDDVHRVQVKSIRVVTASENTQTK